MIHSIHMYMFLNDRNFYNAIKHLNQINYHHWSKLFFNDTVKISFSNINISSINSFKYLFLSITDVPEMLNNYYYYLEKNLIKNIK